MQSLWIKVQLNKRQLLIVNLNERNRLQKMRTITIKRSPLAFLLLFLLLQVNLTFLLLPHRDLNSVQLSRIFR
jgi:hypothetical protein